MTFTLYDLYPALIARMQDRFTSHQFILELARRHQALYIKALYAYRAEAFVVVHRILSRHLMSLPDW
jgi:hypothetical protein